MATANVTSNLKFKIGGVDVSLVDLIAPAYTEVSAGDIGVPDETPDATEFEIPFGSIAAASALLIRNNNTVDMSVSLNGNAALYRLAPGSIQLIVQKVAAGSNPISSASVSTIGIQDGAATVSYAVIGT